jgi:hypothetical protein
MGGHEKRQIPVKNSYLFHRHDGFAASEAPFEKGPPARRFAFSGLKAHIAYTKD